MNPPGALARRLLASLPFSLTAAQERVWREIRTDMAEPYPMNRLLQGDVGSGKTIVAGLAILTAAEAGYQTALMAPTEILAEQHLMTLTALLEPLGVSVALLTNAVKGKARESVLAAAADGALSCVVGTHALVQEVVKFRRLGLAVVDEQHRFGVHQRAALMRKGESPDVLVMTATPIPRTLALTLYGDLEVSVIDQLPPGRKPVVTKARKSIANFKVRAGFPVGCMVTLRGARMYEFLDRLVNIAIPRIRDFRGVSSRAFDGRGNYSLGLKEQIIFPEIEYDKIDALRGMDVAINTTAKTDDEARALLAAFRFPFKH